MLTKVSGKGSWAYGLYIKIDDLEKFADELNNSDAENKVQVVVEVNGLRKEFTFGEFFSLLYMSKK